MDAGRVGHLPDDSGKPQRAGSGGIAICGHEVKLGETIAAFAHGPLKAYFGTPRHTQTVYVRDFLAFLGITDVEFVYAEGLAISEASKNASLAKARESIDRLNPVPA